MTCDEFLSAIKSRGATAAAPATNGQIDITNTLLQQRRIAMLPAYMSGLYTAAGALNLGSGYIFGPSGVQFPDIPAPDIITANDAVADNANICGKTIFGRNDLFWFAFDAFGKCYMLDNLTLATLRCYDDPYRALADCLVAGKF